MRYFKCLMRASAPITSTLAVMTCASLESWTLITGRSWVAVYHTWIPLFVYVETQLSLRRYVFNFHHFIFYDHPQAVAAFDNVAGIGNGCREPCVKTVTVFGFPFLSDELTLDSAYAKLYFKNIVKVTEDHLAYTFLRWIVHIIQIIIYNNYPFSVWWQKLVAMQGWW